jgi:hypothetical protein
MSSFVRSGRVVRSFACLALTVSLLPSAFAAAPTISGVPTTTATVGTQWVFHASGRDADGDTLTYSIANRPVWAGFSTSTGRLAGTPQSKDVGTYGNIIISVSDGKTKVSLPAFTVKVSTASSTNKPPTISGTPSTTARVGTAYAFQPTAADPEGKTLTFSISGKPSWTTFSTTTGRLAGTPTSSNIGTFSNIKISVSDGKNIASLAVFAITVSTNAPPTITGTPSTTASVNTAYSFQPVGKDANGDPLTYSIANKPVWATFSTSTGRLSGTPSTSHIGTTTGIRISVSDGKATASLASFSITVTGSSGGGTGAATLSWTPPTRNTDGTTLTNLAGYRIVYGKSASSLTSTVQIANPGLSSYVVDSLASGTWYFALKSYTSAGVESSPSTVVSKTIP